MEGVGEVRSIGEGRKAVEGIFLIEDLYRCFKIGARLDRRHKAIVRDVWIL